MKQHISREELKQIIDRKGHHDYVPAFFLNWWGIGAEEKYGAQLTQLEKAYPSDVYCGELVQPGNDTAPEGWPNPEYRWGYTDYANAETHGLQHTAVLLEDWEDLPKLLEAFPDPNEPGILDYAIKGLEYAGDRYRLGLFWRVFHEMFWQIRGMETLMYDYVEEVDQLAILGRKLLEFHKGIVDRFAEAGFDGIMTSDDLGFQTGPMVMPSTFEELHLPLYKEFVDYVHSKGMHVWLHSCGDNTLLMDYLVEAGIDVIHPIQKGCMDIEKTVEKYGDKITFLYGIDVQNLMPFGTAQEVRQEVQYAKNLFARRGDHGGLILAAANGIMSDSPLENIQALFEETYRGRPDVPDEKFLHFGSMYSDFDNI